jgi:anaerobic selenocysteine-containing dehydrogenase
MLTWRESWEGPHTTGLIDTYPPQLITPHPRFSFHTHHDGKGGALNDSEDHRALVDGYYYWIARINPSDAAERGITQRDLIRLYNDRGGVICAAQVTERVRPGLVHSYESSAVYDPIDPLATGLNGRQSPPKGRFDCPARRAIVIRTGGDVQRFCNRC